MSQLPRRRATDFADENSLHPKRVKMLLKRNWKILAILPSVAVVLSIISHLVDLPKFVSFSRVQLQQYSFSKLMNDQQFAPNDLLDDPTRLQNVMNMFDTEIFSAALVHEVKKTAAKENLILVPKSDVRFSPSYIFSRMINSRYKFESLNLDEMSKEDLNDLLTSMFMPTLNFTERSVDIKVTAYDAKTAKFINTAVINALMFTARELDRRELNSIQSLFAEQVRNTQVTLQELETKFADFLKSNPHFASEAATNSFYSEYSKLKTRKLLLEKQIESNRALLTLLSQKWQSRNPDIIAKYESLEKANRELVEYKYSRLRLRQLEYKESDTAVMELDDKIARTEKFIKKLKKGIDPHEISEADNSNYHPDALTKINQLREAIQKDEYELKTTDQGLAAMDADAKEMSEKSAIRNYLQREIETFSLVHADAFKRWHMGALRNMGEKGSVMMLQAPTLPWQSTSLPFLKKLIFSIFVGFAFALSTILILESLSPKIVERNDLEGSGMFYAGRLNNSAASKAEILTSLEIVSVGDETNTAEPSSSDSTKIILCASPSSQVDMRYFEPLAKYVADQNRKALMVAIGKTVIPEGYENVNTSRFAHFFQYPGGNEDLIWVLEDDAFDAVKTVLNRYKSAYNTVFLFVHDAEESSVYSLCQKMADSLLLVGAVGAHNVKDYQRLMRGFGKPDATHVALVWEYNASTLATNSKGSQKKIINRLFKKALQRPAENENEQTRRAA